MLERINAALFRAPRGARIQIVAEPKDNNGVDDGCFEYAGILLDTEVILGLRGCSFTVASDREDFQAGVVFEPNAPQTARYDLFEVENGVKITLQKFVRKSDSLPEIAFTLLPLPVEAALRPPAARRAGTRKTARKRARKRTAAKKGGRKTSAKKTTDRRAARKKRPSRKRR
jgi:hypothetical protein